MTFYEPQSCSLPACKRSKLPKFQTPSPTCTLGPRPLPQQAPQGQGQGHFPQQAPQGQATAMAFYGLSKLPFASPQTLQNSPNAPNPPKPAKPSKHRPQQAPQIHSNDFLAAFKALFASPQKLQPHLPQQAPQGQATAMAFYRLSKLPFASPQTLQNSPNAPNPPKPAKPSKHRPQQAPQIHSNDFLPNRPG